MPAIGPWELGEELGRGAMGVVFRARHGGTGREAALKLLLGALDVDEQRRFQREVHMLAGLDHPGVVRLLDHGVDERGRPWLAMELVSGGSLESRVTRGGPLPPGEVLALGRALAGALAHAHGRDLVHRDVKPGNVLLDPAGRPRLADFGLGRRTAPDVSRLTATGTVVGTPLYMAPEQARDARVGPAADVYGLGATLYFALTGRPPFLGPNALAIVRQALQEPPPPLPPQARHPVLEPLLLACLDKDPGARPAADELEELLRLPGAAPRRSRLVPALAGVAIVGALGGGALAAALTRNPPPPPPSPPPQPVAAAEPPPAPVVPTTELIAEARARLTRNDGAAALEPIEELLRRDPSSAAGLGLRALARFCQGVAWEDDAQAALRVDPDQTDALCARGRARLFLGDLPGGLADLRRVRQLTPEDRTLGAWIGLGLYWGSDLPGARHELDAFLAASPGQPSAQALRARVRLSMGDREGAREDADAVLAASPEHPAALAVRAELRMEAGDLPGALEDAQAAVRGGGADLECHMILARVLFLSGRADAALRELDALLDPAAPGATLLRATPMFGMSLGMRAMLHFSRKDIPATRRDLDQLLQVAPRRVDMRVLSAQVHHLQRRLDLADQDLAVALEQAPNDSDALLIRAGVRLSRRDRAGAEADLELLLAAPKNQRVAEQARAMLAHIRSRPPE